MSIAIVLVKSTLCKYHADIYHRCAKEVIQILSWILLSLQPAEYTSSKFVKHVADRKSYRAIYSHCRLKKNNTIHVYEKTGLQKLDYLSREMNQMEYTIDQQENRWRLRKAFSHI